MSKKEKKLENIKQHWLSYPLFICALVEFLWSLENLQFLWFSIFLMCLLVSVCFVWCWIYLWDHLTNNWHFRAYIIKGFCDGWGGGVLYYSHLSFLLSFGIFFLWFIEWLSQPYWCLRFMYYLAKRIQIQSSFLSLLHLWKNFLKSAYYSVFYI